MIAVLGRGASLIKYKEHHQLFNKIYIINDFNREIDILGEDTLKNKEIIQVIGLGPNALTPKNYKRIGVKYVQFNRKRVKLLRDKRIPLEIKPLPDELLGRGFPPLGWGIYLDLKDDFSDSRELGKFVEKKYSREIARGMKKSKCSRAWPTTGLLAIDLAIMENHPDKLYLFGFDLYAKDYLVQKNREYQTENWTKAKMMRYYLEQIIKDFPETIFYNSSEVVSEQKNWINI